MFPNCSFCGGFGSLRLQFAASLGLAALVAPLSAQPRLAPDAVVSRLAFGSCANQDKPQPIWTALRDTAPDVFLFLGDNIYADTHDPVVMARKYRRLAEQPGFAALRAATPILATWDDHDFGENDAGVHYDQKGAARGLLLDFFNEPADSPRWDQPGGIYTAATYGPAGRRVQVILLDLRWARTDLRAVDRATYETDKAPHNLGPYLPDDSAEAGQMDPAQWAWLEARLREPADVRILASSIQCLAEFTGWESWANFPRDRARLLQLIRSTGAKGVVLLSGDTHWTELSRVADSVPYPLWELTSSGITEVWEQISPNQHRVGPAYAQPNFGLVTIDWAAADPVITLSSHAVDGATLITQTFPLSSLQPRHSVQP